MEGIIVIILEKSGPLFKGPFFPATLQTQKSNGFPGLEEKFLLYKILYYEAKPNLYHGFG